MEWLGMIGVVLGSSVLVKFLDIWLARRKRKDDVADRAEERTDKIGALDNKVERYKIETDREILLVRKDMTDMDDRFQHIFTNLDNKLDDSLRHVAKGNALLMAQSVNSISYRALKMLKSDAVDSDEYRNLSAEYQRVKDLVGVPDDPDIIYLDGLMQKINRMKLV